MMIQKEMLPLTEKIVTYLSDYNDFIFHPLKHYLEGFSDDEIIAALDEMDMNEMAEFQHFLSKGENDITPRVVDIDEVAGRKIMP